MSVWRDETDFIKDVEAISEFYISGEHNLPNKKFVFKSKKKHDDKLKSSPWYESDSDDEVGYGFGRGRLPENEGSKAGNDVNHLDIMRGIQMEVRSVVGNRYNNEVLETYFNDYNEDNPDIVCPSPSIAPKEISVSYAKEQRKKTSPVDQEKKSSVAESIESSTAKLNLRDPTTSSSGSSTLCSSSSASSSPKKENRHPNHGSSNRRRSHNRYNRGSPTSGTQSPSFRTTLFSPIKDEVNVNSNFEFPPLS